MSAPELAGEDAFIHWVLKQEGHQAWSIWQQNNPDHKGKIEEATQIVRSLSAQKINGLSLQEKAVLWDRINSTTLPIPGRQSKIIPLMKWVLTAAAALALVIWINTNKAQQIVAFQGQQQSIQLPESSQVVINAGSNVRYKNNFSDKRNIKLYGEGYFEVQPGTTFTVITDHGTITVLGTSFNVIAWPERFEVSCYTGKVRVQHTDADVTEITPGEKVVIANNQLQKQSFAVTDGPSWMNGKFTFENQPMSVVIKELERQFGITVALKDGIEATKYTGLFEKGDLTQALDLITWPLHLTAQVNGNKVIISK
ncbi:MAG: FecR domain-containing protein [Bacteroidota bacterium]|nr:FecR domain-containing protein [Bacteroidota bacterium]